MSLSQTTYVARRIFRFPYLPSKVHTAPPSPHDTIQPHALLPRLRHIRGTVPQTPAGPRAAIKSLWNRIPRANLVGPTFASVKRQVQGPVLPRHSRSPPHHTLFGRTCVGPVSMPRTIPGAPDTGLAVQSRKRSQANLRRRPTPTRSESK